MVLRKIYVSQIEICFDEGEDFFFLRLRALICGKKVIYRLPQSSIEGSNYKQLTSNTLFFLGKGMHIGNEKKILAFLHQRLGAGEIRFSPRESLVIFATTLLIESLRNYWGQRRFKCRSKKPKRINILMRWHISVIYFF